MAAPRQCCGAHAGNDDSSALWLTSSLRLPQVFAAAQLDTLQQCLSRQGPSVTPFLLQAFVTAPNLVEGDPNPRLLTLARLLVQGAKLNGSAKAAAVAAHVIQNVMLVSVCRGFHTEEGISRHYQQPTSLVRGQTATSCISESQCGCDSSFTAMPFLLAIVCQCKADQPSCPCMCLFWNLPILCLEATTALSNFRTG